VLPVADSPQVPHRFDRRRASLGALVLAWGAQAIVTQSLLLREATVLMYGSEFAWGVVLFAWLLGVAVGAAVGGHAARSAFVRARAELPLVMVLVVLSLAACVELWVFRGARAWLGIGPGELLPLPKTALAAILFVSPASALIGLAFPVACCIGAAGRPDRTPCLTFGQIYALESLGSLIGGAAFTFWAVEHLAPIQTALLCGALTCAAATGLLLATPPRHVPTGGWLMLLTCGAVLFAIFGGQAMNRRLIERRWRNVAPGYELVAEAESKYQNLAVGSRAGQFSLYCDGQVTADFPDPYTFVPLAHFWLCEHPQPRRVLVLGGGAEGLIAEILLHPVEHVDYVEPDPRQIGLVQPYLADADRRALADPRVTVHYADARYYLKMQRDCFDLVIARLPEPTSALRARFYTAEFYGELRRAMTPQAVLCLTAAATPAELSPMSREYLASLRATLRRHFPQVIIGWGDPAQVLAATQPGLLTTDPAELAARYAQRGVKSALFDPAWFAGATDWLAPDKLARRAADLDAEKAPVASTDLRPTLYVQRLALWEAMTGKSRLIAWLRSIRLVPLVALLVVVGAVTLLASWIRRRSRDGWAAGAITLSVGTTGFVTMALSIVWLFAFQNLYGYVYQRIGWIIALFMAGLVLGCLLASRPVAPDLGVRRSWQRLIAVDVLLAALALSVPFVLSVLGSLQSSPSTFTLVEWCISLMVVLTGVLGGAAFPLAGELQRQLTGQSAAAAGSVVSADHAGACLGALLCGLLLVPVFGTATAAFLLAGMKLGSGVLLAVGGRLAEAPETITSKGHR
jgi:predicted membrane-bound spermidine synthase